MALMQRLEMRQGQSLVMTPQLLQAIKLLQLSHLDLVSYVEAELERNPLLETAEGGGDTDRFGAPADSAEPSRFDAVDLGRGDIEGGPAAPLDNVFADEPGSTPSAPSR